MSVQDGPEELGATEALLQLTAMEQLQKESAKLVPGGKEPSTTDTSHHHSTITYPSRAHLMSF